MLIKTQYENTEVKAVTPAGEAHNGVPVNGEIKRSQLTNRDGRSGHCCSMRGV